MILSKVPISTVREIWDTNFHRQGLIWKWKMSPNMYENNTPELPVSWSLVKIGFSLVLQVPVHLQPTAEEALTGTPAVLNDPTKQLLKSLQNPHSKRDKCNKVKVKATTKQWNWYSEDRYSVSAGIFQFHKSYSQVWGWLYLGLDFLVEWGFF